MKVVCTTRKGEVKSKKEEKGARRVERVKESKSEQIGKESEGQGEVRGIKTE